ncbi:MAG: peptidoglycan DD-metalloendopeptidase family protein [Chloroflexi bacterium]|nr:peptidoglycan DD-metalloendopeptidase family protein [Chloroflexota bacterium]
MMTPTWAPGANLPDFLYSDLTRQIKETEALQARQLESLHPLGIRRLRLFAFHRDIDPAESVRRAALALDLLYEFGFDAVLTFADGRTDTFQPGAVAPCSALDFFSARRYRDHLLPAVEMTVSALREHPALLGWEMGNRFALRPNISPDDSRAFMMFVSEMGGTVLNIDPNAYVSIGTASCNDVTPEEERELFARRLYTLGCVTLASVAGATALERAKAFLDYNLARELSLPFYAYDVALETTAEALKDEGEMWRESDAFAIFVSPDVAAATQGQSFPWKVEYDPTLTYQANALAASFSPKQTRTYVVMNGPLGVRTNAKISARRLYALQAGAHIEVDASSRTEADKFVWWRHRDGWSAEKSLDGRSIYMRDRATLIPPPPSGKPGTDERPTGVTPIFIDQPDIPFDVNTLPLRDLMFQLLPVESGSIEWVQYYGNTTFAYRHGKAWNYDGYSQGLHGGFDFGVSPGTRVPVRAGVHGTVVRPGLKFGPRRVDIRVGDYLIIFGHLHAETPRVPAGMDVNPDTVIGTIASSVAFAPHVHIEIRYPYPSFHTIINPLLFMPDTLRSRLLAFPTDFYSHTLNWTRWATPFDQPVIHLGGRVVGPRARF